MVTYMKKGRRRKSKRRGSGKRKSQSNLPVKRRSKRRSSRSSSGTDKVLDRRGLGMMKVMNSIERVLNDQRKLKNKNNAKILAQRQRGSGLY